MQHSAPSNLKASKKVSVPALLAIAIVAMMISATATFLFMDKRPANPTENIGSGNSSPAAATTNSCDKSLVRLKGYGLVKPLLYTEADCEASSLSNIKANISGYIDQQKTAGIISSASVYVRLLNTADWTAINSAEGYFPGSLFKLPLMIALLRTEQIHPGFLQQKVLFPAGQTANISQTFEAKTIQAGHTYTIKELLEYMIIYSDNYASQLLNAHVNQDILLQSFRDLGLTVPPTDASYFNYKITAKDYSRFMITLYNSSYLSPALSEYAAEILGKSSFNEGVTRQLPADLKVAHKFGEAGHGTEMQLHESAIIFVNDNPYIITIMTSGSNVKQLSNVLSDISKMVYDHLNKPAV